MAQPASGKPSLIDPSPSSSTEEGSSIRMLDALESSARPTRGVAARRGFGWIFVGLVLLAGCAAGLSWWSQRSHVDDADDRTAQTSGPAASDVTKMISAPASAASAALEPSPGATIIASTEPEVAAAVPVPVAASNPADAASAAAVGASKPGPVAIATPHNAAAKPAKTKANTLTSSRDTRVAARSQDDRKRPAPTTGKGAGAGAGATTTASGDPDVALLSAMLATMSGDPRVNQNGAPSAQTQLTIAQLVQRCDARGVKDAIETFECKRRICEGYWGKADACPMSLSPKKN